MRRLLLVALTFFAGCIAVPIKGGPAVIVTPSSESAGSSSSESCAFDSQCPGGSCRFGTCSPFPPDASSCSFDSQCPGGTCSFGRCSP